eukprot:TRINITY_DN10713_c0_g1_i2.p1 TRINITY_DN10713_c0_g1~~TRINITY_DN10713_c0_g1_i2.p1  ORF type:complete len:448 (-),score=104.94 TRINITY_DN10713_c0_g1_i2:324-1598(-)
MAALGPAFITLPASSFAVEAQHGAFAGTRAAAEKKHQQRKYEQKRRLVSLRGIDRRSDSASSSSQKGSFSTPALAGAALAVYAALRRRQQKKRLAAAAQEVVYDENEAQSIYQKALKIRTERTISRIMVPTVITVVVAIFGWPVFVHMSKVFLGGTAGIEGVWDNFVGQWIALFGLLFSILAGSSYSSLYAQNESIYLAFYSEVSEAKALLEQVSLISQGRSIYDTLLKYIEQYVKEDLCRTDKDPAEQLAMKPKDDPLESILYITSVGLPSSIYDTVRSIRQLRGQRLGSMQRKMPRIQLSLLWILGSALIAGFPMMAADAAGASRSFALRAMFGVLCGSVSMTLRVIHEIWRTSGGAYNVDSVLTVAVHGLSEELRLRRAGRAFGFTSLPPPPCYAPFNVAAEQAIQYGNEPQPEKSTEEEK